ncbi:MAG TPA: L-lactate permease [Terracidiphilus sp.]|jgi:lactate permease|nr:L-lactate permease [Terracidiphilus sp.]
MKTFSPPTGPPKPAASLLPFAVGIAAGVVGVIYLLKTNPAAGAWAQTYDPTGHWQLSTLLAALPIIVLLGAMAILRAKAHIAAVAGLSTALLISIAIYHMPARFAFTAAGYGAGYGLFPICWIILPVIFLYNLTVKTGRFVTLQESLANITNDSRLQLLLIAFALGAFFEGTCGFGTPVAVCGAILISLGFRPLEAAGLSLIANTAPVAFGALGIPTITLHGVTNIDLMLLSRTIGVILTPFCVLVPFWLIWAYAGFRAMIEVWPPILVAGTTFATAQLLVATFYGPSLAAIVAAISTMVVLITFLRFWKPKRVLNVSHDDITGHGHTRFDHSTGKTFKAWLPWLVLCIVVFAWGTPQFSHWLDAQTTIKFPVAGLNNFVARIPPVVTHPTPEPAIFSLNWATATGTAILVAALIAGISMGLGPRSLVATFFQTIIDIRFTVITIACMMALGFITRYSGLDATLGLAFARTGAFYPFFGTLIGWLGTATTGSDTSSNVLFGSLQKVAAHQIGVSPVLMASANSAGGVMGKMVDAQSIVVASTATQNYGQEGAILRFVLMHSLALASLVGAFVYLMAYVHPFTALVAH